MNRSHFAFAVAPGTLDRIVAPLLARQIEMYGPVEHDGGTLASVLGAGG